MLEKGTLIKVKTKTLQDIFGEVVYEITETGLPAPEKDRKGKMDGVKAVMLGGNGLSARRGYVVFDSEWKIQQDISRGVTVVLLGSKKKQILDYYDHVESMKQ
jgi:hypothetical protein